MTTEQKNLARLGVLGFAILLASGAFGTRELLFPSTAEIKVVVVKPPVPVTRAPASESPAVTAIPQIENSPLLPVHNHQEHRDQDDCYKSMRVAAKYSPEEIKPLTQDEIFAGLFTSPKIEALYNEFEEVINLPDGSKALKRDLTTQFEQSLEQLDKSGATASSVDL